MAITPLPPAPSRAVPSTFSTLADAFIAALPGFVTEANALEANVNAKEVITVAASSTASSASAVALAAANYKGEWSAQAGAATVPYCVSHLGKYWQLSSNLANVAAKTPGTDSEWIEVNSDHSCENITEIIQYPIPTAGYMLKAGTDGSPATATNTDAEVALAVANMLAASFKINPSGNEADLQTTGLTGDRDYTFPDVDTMLAGAVVMTQNTFEVIAYA